MLQRSNELNVKYRTTEVLKRKKGGKWKGGRLPIIQTLQMRNNRSRSIE